MEIPTNLPVTQTVPSALFLWQMMIDPLETLTRLAEENGDIVHVRFRKQDIYLLNHPDFIEQVLVKQSDKFVKGRSLQRAKVILGDGLLTSEGGQHLAQCRTLQPSFQRSHIEQYLPLMVMSTQKRLSHWQDGQRLNLSDEMMRLTLDIALWSFFRNSPEGAAERVSKAMRTLIRLFPMTMLPLPDSTGKLFPRFKQTRDNLALVTEALIAHPSWPQAQNALIHLLKQYDAARFAEEQIRAHVLTFLLAGHGTTALLLAWAVDMFAHHASVQNKLQAEVDSVLGGHALANGDLEKLTYTRAVIQETLRLRPPAWTIGRQSLIDCEIGGYTIPAGSTVLFSPWVMQRDARYFEEPESFHPERWLASAALPRFAYFPFGGGSRVCIGEHFAITEAVTVLVMLAKDWNFQSIQPPAKTKPSVTLRPRKGIAVKIEKRNQ